MTNIARAILHELELVQGTEPGKLEYDLRLMDAVVRMLRAELEKARICYCRCPACRRAGERHEGHRSP